MANKGVRGPKKSASSPKEVPTASRAGEALASYGTRPRGAENGGALGQAGKVLPMPLQLRHPEPKKPRGKKQRQPRVHDAAPTNMVEIYKHDDKRKNNPLAGLIEFDRPPPQPTRTYAYNAHLDPQLTWAGKAEHPSFAVDTVSLHIHERVSSQAVLRAVKREDVQTDLFARFELPESKVIDFYQHEVGWANRLILGDSLTVMNSLLEREQMAGKVQMIYLDPPYGVRFNSNFQARISKRDAKDGDDASLTREPEQIQAYRDTWTLGVHSYLTYLRDRLRLARELLADSGSLFVQISDKNVHHVRELLDEVLGADNFCSQIVFKTTSSQTDRHLASVADVILWYAKDAAQVKYRPLFDTKTLDDDIGGRYTRVELPNGERRPLTTEERANPQSLRDGARIYRHDNLTSSKPPGSYPITFEGQTFTPGKNFWKTNEEGMKRLAASRRLAAPTENSLAYVRFLNDFPCSALTNIWTDTQTGAFTENKLYVVQTNTKVIARCMLFTTDPGDLVLDPTCGSGTTAAVAEQWGRRWVTCDTSRVALALARQRLLTAKYPFYRLRSTRVRDGFWYKTVPHITLKSIAQNARLDECKTQADRERVIRESADQEILYDQPDVDSNRIRVTGPFTVEAIPVASLDDMEVNAETSTGPTPEHPATDHLSMMIDLLKRSGVQFPNNRHLAMPTLRAVRGPYEYLHAEAEIPNGATKRAAISFGPRHAPVTPAQVLGGINETRGYDIVIFVGFACDPEARRIIDAGVHGRELQYANAAPDILVGDLLKTTKTTRLFTAFGAPDVKVEADGDEHIKLTLAGVDLYDPNSGETTHRSGDDVAAWFVDHDYDGRTFCICQALFPGGGQNPWEKLQKALKGTIHEDRFETLRTAKSLPFKPGKKVAVKVIDDRGNDVIKLVDPKPPRKKGGS